MPETIISSTNFWDFIESFLRLVSSRRSSEDDMCLFAKDSRNYKFQKHVRISYVDL